VLAAGNKRSFWQNLRDNDGGGARAPRVAYAFVVYAGYCVVAQADRAFTLQPGFDSAFSFTDALLMAALLGPPRTWWVVLAGALPAHVIGELANYGSLPVATADFLSHFGPILIVAAFLRKLGVWPPRFQTFRDVILFIISACIFPSLIGASLETVTNHVARGDVISLEVWSRLFFSKTVSFALVIPLVVTTINWVREGRKITWRRFIEAALLCMGVLASVWAGFGSSASSGGHWSALICGPLSCLIWAAVRFGVGGTSGCLLLMTLCAAGFSTHDRGPFTQFSPAESAHALQIFLVTVSVPLLVLAALFQERPVTSDRDLQTLREDFRRRLSDQAGALDDLRMRISQSGDSSSAIIADLERLQEVASNLEKEFRALTHALRADVERKGFEGVLRAFCQEFGASANLRVHVTFEGRANKISTSVAWCCFRVVHSGLRYAAKHAQATEAQVKIAAGMDRIFLMLAENGAETSGPAVIEGRSEAIRMKRCVESLSGDFRIAKRETRGTLVMVVLPI